ncbi:MAG: hypothetical protein ISS47_01810 [Candidatus Omnitrophica bacterium]|nr:hypothetical protein [Candidatus Omnitrophota bacterium]
MKINGLFYQYLKKYYVIFILSFIICFHIADNIAFLKIDNYFPVSDDSEHLLRSIECYEFTNSPSIEGKKCPGCWTPCEAYTAIFGNIKESLLM